TPVGIDVEAIVDRPCGFESSAFSPAERLLLDRWSGPARAEWAARLWCAREAAAKAAGIALAGGPAAVEVVPADESTGVGHGRFASDLRAAGPRQIEYKNPLKVVSARHGEYAWAWTLGQGVEP